MGSFFPIVPLSNQAPTKQALKPHQIASIVSIRIGIGGWDDRHLSYVIWLVPVVGVGGSGARALRLELEFG